MELSSQPFRFFHDILILIHEEHGPEVRVIVLMPNDFGSGQKFRFDCLELLNFRAKLFGVIFLRCEIIVIADVNKLINNFLINALKCIPQFRFLFQFHFDFPYFVHPFRLLFRDLLHLTVRFYKLNQIRQLLNIHCFSQGVVIILQLLFPPLNKLFICVVEQLFMRKIRQLILVLSCTTSLMNFPQLTISCPKNYWLLLFILCMNLN